MSEKRLDNSSGYIWVRILPDDFYEDGINAVWCKMDNEKSKPVAIDDKVVYYRKGMLGRLTGQVVDVFLSNKPFDETRVYHADPYKKAK